MSSKRKYPGNPNLENYTQPASEKEREMKMAKIKLVAGIIAAVVGLAVGLFVLN